MTERKEKFIKDIRKLDSEIKTILKENDEADGKANNEEDSTKMSKYKNLPGLKSVPLDSQYGHNEVVDGYDLSSPKDISKRGNGNSSSALNHLNSDGQIPKTPPSKNYADGASSPMPGKKEAPFNDKKPEPFSKKDKGFPLNSNDTSMAGKSTDTGSIPLVDGPSLANNEAFDPNKKMGNKIGDISQKKQPTAPLVEGDAFKKKNSPGTHPLDEINKKDVDESVLPEINQRNDKSGFNSKKSGVVGAEPSEIDNDVSNTGLKSKTNALGEQKKLNSSSNKAPEQSLPENNLKRKFLEETLNGLLPQSKRQSGQKHPISSSPFFDEQLRASKKANIAQSIDNKINEANYDVQNAHVLENKAVLHKKEADSLKASANVDKKVAKEIGPTSLGSQIQKK
ncbi:MAG: hypothetical protein ACRCU2_17440, partial [Planktothrix sp.]